MGQIDVITKGLVKDQAQIEEFKQESARLLGAPLLLPESCEDEGDLPLKVEQLQATENPEPMGYLPDGTPFFNEAEKEQLIAQQLQEMGGTGPITKLTEKAGPTKVEPPPAKQTIETPPPADKKAGEEAERKRKQEAAEEQLPAREKVDLDF